MIWVKSSKPRLIRGMCVFWKPADTGSLISPTTQITTKVLDTRAILSPRHICRYGTFYVLIGAPHAGPDQVRSTSLLLPHHRDVRVTFLLDAYRRLEDGANSLPQILHRRRRFMYASCDASALLPLGGTTFSEQTLGYFS